MMSEHTPRRWYGIPNSVGGFTFARTFAEVAEFVDSEPNWPTAGPSRSQIVECQPRFDHPNFLEFNDPIEGED